MRTFKQTGSNLTLKQKAFADELLNNPKQSATKAVLKTYGTTKDYVAKNIASENLAKPNIQVYLEQHVDKAKYRVIELIDSDKEEIALRAADSVLDRALGKATQRTESVSVSLNFGMDLTSVAEEQS
jgi:phage terminase small subunit